eukprot:3704668-Amphidinium_carterae.1
MCSFYLHTRTVCKANWCSKLARVLGSDAYWGNDHLLCILKKRTEAFADFMMTLTQRHSQAFHSSGCFIRNEASTARRVPSLGRNS